MPGKTVEMSKHAFFPFMDCWKCVFHIFKCYLKKISFHSSLLVTKMDLGKRRKLFKTYPSHSAWNERCGMSSLSLCSQKAVQILPSTSTWPLLSSTLFTRAATAPGKGCYQEAKIQLITVDVGGHLLQPLSSILSLRNYPTLTFHQLRDLDGSSHSSCLKAVLAVLQVSPSQGILGAAAVSHSSVGYDCKAM